MKNRIVITFSITWLIGILIQSLKNNELIIENIVFSIGLLILTILIVKFYIKK
jgi:hypothetical protein